jgi:hypothetical protein
MERDGLAPAQIMTTGLQRPKVPQAATDPYAVTRVRRSRSSRIEETCKGGAYRLVDDWWEIIGSTDTAAAMSMSQLLVEGIETCARG